MRHDMTNGIRSNLVKLSMCLLFIFHAALAPQKAHATSLNIMAPLLIKNESEWTELVGNLKALKEAGFTAVTSDIWWGVVEKEKGVFDWSYYDRLAAAIKEADLQWIPIMSTHSAGGNVGDDVHISIPDWIFNSHLAPGTLFEEPVDLKYVSEYGMTSNEVISAFAIHLFEREFKDFYRAFLTQYSDYAPRIKEVILSLGAAGEWRYPSFNRHDGKERADWPTRGALQAYSRPAVEQFRDFVMYRYGSIEAVNAAWSFNLSSREQIYPPTGLGDPHMEGYGFFSENLHHTPYGKDFFEWYHKTLLNSGQHILTWGAQIFNDIRSPLRDVPLGVKIPGIHWKTDELGKRIPEILAGLIKPDHSFSLEAENLGKAYHSIFARTDYVSQLTGAQIKVHFTAIEMADNPEHHGSRAESLTQGVIAEALQHGVNVGGENALGGHLLDSTGAPYAKMLAAAQQGMSSITLLRYQYALQSLDQIAGFAEALRDIPTPTNCEMRVAN